VHIETVLPTCECYVSRRSCLRRRRGYGAGMAEDVEELWECDTLSETDRRSKEDKGDGDGPGAEEADDREIRTCVRCMTA